MINWLVQTATELPALPATAWLSPPEQERLSTLRIEKKRREWLLGRWTAKRLVQAYLEQVGAGHVDMADIAITPGADGAPELGTTVPDASPTLQAALCALRLTISHSNGRSFCALAQGGVGVGADIEAIAARSPVFATDFFTPGELALVAAAPVALHDTLVTAVWSAKEAVLKALRLGLTVDTRMVECLPPLPLEGADTAQWAAFVAHCHPSLGGPPAGVTCWWRADDAFVLVLAVAEPLRSFA
jgi:4'-phosphopantetheinyl transferase